MIKPLQAIDTFALNKVFTPLAHYAQRKLWLISYDLAKFFCEITAALAVAVTVYHAFFLHTQMTVLLSLGILVSLAVSALYFYISTQLHTHLQRTDAWQKEPLIAARAFATIDWYFPFCFILAVLAVANIPGLLLELFSGQALVNAVHEQSAAATKPVGSEGVYQVLRMSREVCEASALYLLRVRPLPPSMHEEKGEESLNPI